MMLSKSCMPIGYFIIVSSYAHNKCKLTIFCLEIQLLVLFYRLLHSFHQRLPFFFRYAGNADILSYQPGEGAVVILGQYFRQLLLDGFVISVLVHNLDFMIYLILQITTTLLSSNFSLEATSFNFPLRLPASYSSQSFSAEYPKCI